MTPIIKKLILSLILLFVIINSLSATDNSNNALDFRKLGEEHITSSAIIGVSSNSLEDVAIGFDDNYINVYDKNGIYKTSYAFKIYGKYVFEYNVNNIVIFPIRAEAMYYFNLNGELLKIKRFSDSSKSYKHYKTIENKKYIKIDDSSYTVEQTFGYVRFVKTDIDGDRTIIYDIGKKNYYKKILIWVLVLLIVIIGISYLIIYTIKSIKSKLI